MENNNGVKPFTLKQSIKFGFFIFFYCIVLLVTFLLIGIGGINGLKELIGIKGVSGIIKPIMYGFILFALIVSLGVFIGYKKRNDKSFPKKILTIQNPLIMTILSSFGVSFNESNQREFYFYYNLLFGISLTVFGFILFFTSNDYRIGLIPFGFGIITIIWGIIKRK